MSTTDHATVTVRLLGLPVRLHQDGVAHVEAIRREFDILHAADEEDSVPRRLARLMGELRGRYGGLDGEVALDLDGAIDAALDVTDVAVEVPHEATELIARFAALLDEVDEYCRAGEHLLTLAAPPESVAYRRWFFGEFVAQLAGRAPVPWNGVAAESSEADDPPATPAGSEPSQVSSAPTGQAGDGPRSHLPAGWQVHEHGSEIVVRPCGELDLLTAPELRDLVQAVRKEHTDRVELDLAEVSFIDSVGLSMIVSAHRRLVADGVDLSVAVPPDLRRLFDISGLDQLLELRA